MAILLWYWYARTYRGDWQNGDTYRRARRANRAHWFTLCYWLHGLWLAIMQSSSYRLCSHNIRYYLIRRRPWWFYQFIRPIGTNANANDTPTRYDTLNPLGKTSMNIERLTTKKQTCFESMKMKPGTDPASGFPGRRQQRWDLKTRPNRRHTIRITSLSTCDIGCWWVWLMQY